MHIPRIIVSSSQFKNYEECKLLSTTLCSKDSVSINSAPDHLSLQLDDKQTRHLTRALRRKEESAVELLVREDSSLYSGNLFDTDRKVCKVQITSVLPTIVASPLVHLLLGQASNKVIEQVVQQATELGVSSCTIYPGTHTGNKTRINLERLGLIRDSAVEQARLSHIPEIDYSSSLPEIIERIQGLGTQKLLCISPNEDYAKSQQVPLITNVLPITQKKHQDSKYQLEKQEESVEIYIAVGPEGGFSLSEIELYLSNGFQAVSLGPYVARVETAVTLAVGISRLAVTV